MDATTKLWSDAYEKLESNSEAEVFCPACKTGTLKLKTEKVSEALTNITFICDSCGEHDDFKISLVTISDEKYEEDHPDPTFD